LVKKGAPVVKHAMEDGLESWGGPLSPPPQREGGPHRAPKAKTV